MNDDTRRLEAEVQGFWEKARALQAEIAREIVGQEELVRHILTALLGGGHALIEGVPGLGKTRLVRTLSRALDLAFARIQFTPDLMPADITGTNIVSENDDGARTFTFQKGPLFASVVLADEINRATPKTQSALLEAMQEQNVTVAGVCHALPRPFMVLATQNPIEMEGTYPLPEAQVDRFLFKLEVSYPDRASLVEILDRTTGSNDVEATQVMGAQDLLRMQALVREILVAPHLKEYTARLVLATHGSDAAAPPSVKKYVRYGASPRGGQATLLGAKALAFLSGRYNVSEEDLRACALPALRHRLILNFEGEAEGISPDAILSDVLEAIPVAPARVSDLGV